VPPAFFASYSAWNSKEAAERPNMAIPGTRAQAHLTAFPTEDGAAEPADLPLIAAYGGATQKSSPPR